MTNIQENLGPEPNKEDFTLISDPSVRGKINAQLEYITAREFLTPYVGLEAVRKILAYSNIFVPNTVFLEKTSGYDIFDADQFGAKMGMTNDGEVVTAPVSPYKIYFEWQLNSDGEYDIFCSIVSDDELEELLADTEEEDEEDEDEEEEMNEEKKPPFEGPYSKTVAPKTEKKKHNEVAKLARRAIKKVKKKLEEDYDHIRKAEARDAGAIAKRARNPKEKKFWKKAHKDLSKDAVEGRVDESVLGDIATGVGIGGVAGLAAAGTTMILHGKYGKKKKSVADRLMDTKHEKNFQKYNIQQADSSLKRATKPKTIERLNKAKSDAQSKLKKASYLKSLLPEENINEISVGKAEKAYQAAKNKLLDNDIMVGMTKGPPKMKWIKRSNKRHNQAVKFANYAAKKKYEDSKTK